MNSTIIDAEEIKGYSYVQLDSDDTPVPEKYYVNNAVDSISTKTEFDPIFSAASADLDAVITVTEVPSGTEVFIDGVSGGTMSNTTLTLTAQESGEYKIELKKSKYQDYTTTYTVKRYGE